MRILLAGLVTLCACSSPHILKTGVLTSPAYLQAGDFGIWVEFVQSGQCWTNVWMDVVVTPLATTENRLDPTAFSLKASDTGRIIKHVSRQLETFRRGSCGSREPQGEGSGGKGTRTPTTGTLIEPGEVVRATLMFETAPGEAELLKEFDLVYKKHQTLHFGGVQDPPAAAVRGATKE